MAIGIVGLEGNSSLSFGYGLIILLLQRIELTQARMGRRQGIVQSEGLSHQLKSALRGLRVSQYSSDRSTPSNRSAPTARMPPHTPGPGPRPSPTAAVPGHFPLS